jgi:hypothetical protein
MAAFRDGRGWSAEPAAFPVVRPAYTVRQKSNYVLDGAKRRVAFVTGLFRPEVLCEDKIGGKLWLGAYSGVASIPLPGGTNR